MKVYREECIGRCVELSITNFDLHNDNSQDYSDLTWELLPLLGKKEQIVLYINNLYLIIIENTNGNDGYDYIVNGRYITKHPFLSNLFCITPALPEIWGNEVDGYIRQMVPMVKEWVRILVMARKCRC